MKEGGERGEEKEGGSKRKVRRERGREGGRK